MNEAHTQFESKPQANTGFETTDLSTQHTHEASQMVCNLIKEECIPFFAKGTGLD